ncbi:MAG: hypothetical protein AAGI46_14310, partial [Planctomycetota bacterium]
PHHVFQVGYYSPQDKGFYPIRDFVFSGAMLFDDIVPADGLNHPILGSGYKFTVKCEVVPRIEYILLHQDDPESYSLATGIVLDDWRIVFIVSRPTEDFSLPENIDRAVRLVDETSFNLVRVMTTGALRGQVVDLLESADAGSEYAIGVAIGEGDALSADPAVPPE